MRVGSTNRRADDALIAEMQRFARGEAFDERPMPGLNSEAIDFLNMDTQAAPGDSLPLINKVFVDTNSGRTYTINLAAYEYWGPTGGTGDVSLNISNIPGEPNFQVYSVFGGGTFAQQGVAHGQAVDFSVHNLEISVHSWAHSDAPSKIIFFGPVTVDLRLNRSSGQIRVDIFAPKGVIKLEGNLTP